MNSFRRFVYSALNSYSETEKHSAVPGLLISTFSQIKEANLMKKLNTLTWGKFACGGTVGQPHASACSCNTQYIKHYF